MQAFAKKALDALERGDANPLAAASHELVKAEDSLHKAPAEKPAEATKLLKQDVKSDEKTPVKDTPKPALNKVEAEPKPKPAVPQAKQEVKPEVAKKEEKAAPAAKPAPAEQPKPEAKAEEAPR